MTDKCCSTQLIYGDGAFNVAGVDNFTKTIKLGECGVSYAVVSIMGPQSSGKSTLLNHLFRTNFREMDALRGISQTTKGIWLAKCAEIEPCTIVMDLEGTDGRERGEDDTAFEKQSALFALAVSDIVLINMWCHDIGREQAANRPLLKTVFQAMMQLFDTRKTTLLFVIRDQRRTPLEKLESILREDIQKIWDSVPKPQAHKETPLSEFFNVEVVALSSYEETEEQFKEQVASLRQRFFHSIAPGGLAGDRRGVVPASGFSFSAQQIWKIIKQNKDLDLPAHKVMVATVRCEEIANEKFADFAGDEDWLQLEKAAQVSAVRNFGKKVSSLLDKCLSGYDMEATYFDDAVRTAKLQQLESKLQQLVHPAFQSVLGHLRSKALDDFKASLDNALGRGEGFAVAARDCTKSFMTSFDEGSKDAAIAQAKWDSSKVREKLHQDIDAHVASVRAAKLLELTSKYERQLNKALAEPVEALLDAASDDTWPAIRKLLQRETKSAVSGLSSALSSFDIDQVTLKNILAKLEDYARSVVESKSREEAGRVLIRMKDRFSTLFSRDSDSMPRVWTGKEDISAITKTAHSASLKLLSVMAAIRLDEENDKIENTLSLALVDAGGAAAKNRSIQSVDPLASSSWEEVPPEKTLITPVQCKYLWRQFNSEMEYTVTQAISAQVMFATVRCEEIANEKFADFAGDKDWLQLEKAAQVRVVHNFGKKLSSLLDKCLSGYDMEATYFDDAVRTAKRQQLESKLLQLFHPAFQSVLGYLRSKVLDDFKASLDNALGRGEDVAVAAPDYVKSFMTSFDEGSKDAAIAQAKWDSSEVRENLHHDMDAHVVSILAAELAKHTSNTESLKKALDKAKSTLEARMRNKWVRFGRAIGNFFGSSTE